MENIPSTHKTCPKCKTSKPVNAFSANKTTKDGLQVWCIACRNANYAAKHPSTKILPSLGCKFCTKCQTEKPLDLFVRASKEKDGFASVCKECKKDISGKERVRNKANFHSTTTPESKICSTCHTRLPSIMFSMSRSMPDGLSPTCRPCDAIRHIEDDNRKRNTDMIGVRVTGMLRDAKARAKAEGLPLNIDEDYIRSLVTTHCPALGIRLDFYATTTTPASPSLDRFYPDLGYIKGNLRILSHRANVIKNNSSVEERLMLVAWMQKIENAKSNA